MTACACRSLPLALVAALVGGCGESADRETGARSTPTAAPAASDPADVLARLAARKPEPPAANGDEARWGADVRMAVLQGARARWRMTLHSWEARSPSGGTALVRRADVAPSGTGADTDAGWIRLTDCASAPELAAAEHAAYLTPLEAAGSFVRPWPGLGVPAFVSNLDDARLETMSWQRGRLTVSAVGMTPPEVVALHSALERAGLYGDVPASPRPPALPATHPATPPGNQPDSPAAEAPARDAGASLAGRWSGGTFRERVSLHLGEDGSFEATEARAGRTSTARGTWTASAGGVVLTVTHEEDKPARKPVTVTGRLVGEALELRSSESKDVVLLQPVR